jgi:hypothetical protein
VIKLNGTPTLDTQAMQKSGTLLQIGRIGSSGVFCEAFLQLDPGEEPMYWFL